MHNVGFLIIIKTNKCSDRSMKVKLIALLDNYDRQTDQPTTKGKQKQKETPF